MSGPSFAGNVPRVYDTNLGPVWFQKYALDMAAITAAGKPRQVLEIACGTGIVTRALRSALRSDAKIVATDFSEDMLAVAREKFTSSDDVALKRADGAALPFDDGMFDAAVCQFGMMFYPDRQKGLREAYRVLAAGGRYLFSVWDDHRFNPLGRVLDETLAGIVILLLVLIPYFAIRVLSEALGEGRLARMFFVERESVSRAPLMPVEPEMGSTR